MMPFVYRNGIKVNVDPTYARSTRGTETKAPEKILIELIDRYKVLPVAKRVAYSDAMTKIETFLSRGDKEAAQYLLTNLTVPSEDSNLKTQLLALFGV